MDHIIEPGQDFHFSKLSLTLPTGIQGGAYFTKIQYYNKPLYIQTTKSLTRQGIVKSGKKYHSDLMFDKNSEVLIQWFENLEETCQKLIYEKADTWFQSALEMNDVESAFNSTIRIYKSGKYYLVRVNIKTNHQTGEPNIKIYDENEIPLTVQDINNETNVISILEIQGIKFTSRNFQIEMELKQMMVLNEPIFENCLIKKKKMDTLLEEATKKTNAYETITQTNKEVSTNLGSLESMDITDTLEVYEPVLDSMVEPPFVTKKTPTLETLENENVLKENKPLETNVLKVDTSKIENHEIKEENENRIEKEEKEEREEIDEDMKEINIQLEGNLDINDSITLKKPNQIYYELYKEARKKAKVAKKNALIAYLEAKNIKKTYMLEDLSDSDEEDGDLELDFQENSDSESVNLESYF